MNVGLLPLKGSLIDLGPTGNFIVGLNLSDYSGSVGVISLGSGVVLGNNADQSIVLGNTAVVQSSIFGTQKYAIVVGYGATAFNATGGGATTDGSVVIGKLAQSGTSGGFNNGTNVAVGMGAKAQGSLSVAIGSSSQAGANFNNASTALGSGAIASGANALALGANMRATGNQTVSIGITNGLVTQVYAVGINGTATANWAGNAIQMHGQVANSAMCQASIMHLGNQTTDATQTILYYYKSLAYQNTLPNNTIVGFEGFLVARNSSTNDSSFWRFQGLVKRGATAATTTLVGSISTQLVAQDTAASAWSFAISVDTTNGFFPSIKVTGAASTSINWYARIDTAEVG